MSSTDHMVTLPKWIWIVKIVQTVLAAIILALSAFGVHYIAYSGYAYSIFTTLYTAIILTYYFVTLHAWNQGYNWIAMLVLETVAVVFWLSTWACLAVVSVAVNADSTYDGYGYYDYGFKLRKRDSTTYGTLFGVTIAAAIFAVIEWILFIITLVFLGINIHRHRKAGKPMVAGGPRTGTGTVANGGDVPAHGEPAMVMATGDNSYPLQQQEAKNPQYAQYPASADQVPQYQQSPAVPQPYNAAPAAVSPQHTGTPVQPQNQPSPYAQQQPYQPAVSPPPTGHHHEMQ